jgi:hypothetical protein
VTRSAVKRPVISRRGGLVIRADRVDTGLLRFSNRSNRPCDRAPLCGRHFRDRAAFGGRCPTSPYAADRRMRSAQDG